ncbi:hypothetical protein [Deinococcus soli (ex Cha et al. 2016)]|nr:hypothetical protein [Deinococcus soli (ex Cha et al. 2016)]
MRLLLLVTTTLTLLGAALPGSSGASGGTNPAPITTMEGPCAGC